MKHIKKYLIVIPMLVSFEYVNAMDTAIAWAIHNDHPNVANFLITADTNVNTAISRQLGWLTNRPLIAAGADVDLVTEDGSTALMLAARQNHTEVAERLIAAGANFDLVNQNGYTALIYAAQSNSTEIARLLIAAGANVNLVNRYGYTALMDAAVSNRPEIVRLLIVADANVDLITQYGCTALMVAARQNRPEIARLLIAAGADPTIPTSPTTTDPEGRFAHQLVPTGDTDEEIANNNAFRTELENWYNYYANPLW